MTVDRTDNQGFLCCAFGGQAAPATITQEGFEFDDRHLRRLVRLRRGDRPEASDLWEYTQDLLYTEIQTPLFSYLLPFCLEAWREALRGIRSEYGGFVEYLYLVLADRQVFDKHLTPRLSAAVSEFMRQTILEEINHQRGLAFQGTRARPYRWVRAVTTYGVLRPDLDRLWTNWWCLEAVGRAIAALQYISCLMYSEHENPVFAPWTPNGGGGPPCLWEYVGHLFSHRWLEANVNFLTGILAVSGVGDVLNRAVECLAGQTEYDIAVGMQKDFPLCIETLESGCAEVPRMLGTTSQGKGRG